MNINIIFNIINNETLFLSVIDLLIIKRKRENLSNNDSNNSFDNIKDFVIIVKIQINYQICLNL